MLFSLRNYPRFGLVCLSVLGLIAILHSSRAHAYTILGQDIYYHGGSLQFQILPYEAAYTSQIYLHTGTATIFLGNSSSVGAVITISDPAALGLNPEDEFVLGIHVMNTGDNFVMGGSYDNPDGIVHALVNYGYNHTAVIGFEDLLGGGDLDYDDAVVKVLGNIGVAQIPEASTMLMLGSGILCLAYVLRVK